MICHYKFSTVITGGVLRRPPPLTERKSGIRICHHECVRIPASKTEASREALSRCKPIPCPIRMARPAMPEYVA